MRLNGIALPVKKTRLSFTKVWKVSEGHENWGLGNFNYKSFFFFCIKSLPPLPENMFRAIVLHRGWFCLWGNIWNCLRPSSQPWGTVPWASRVEARHAVQHPATCIWQPTLRNDLTPNVTVQRLRNSALEVLLASEGSGALTQCR